MKNNATIFDLSGRCALVTGAGGGMGREISRGFAHHGADLACLDLTEELASPGLEAVRLQGRRALPVGCDVRDPEAIRAAVERVLQAFQRIDILVNLAGSSVMRPALEYTLDDWSHMMNTYLRSTFLFCQTVGRHMVERGSGSIINVSSIAGQVALGRGTAPYGAAKAGVNALTRELALEWARKGVRVNAIAPCQINTPQLQQVLNDPQFDRQTLLATWLNAIPMGRLGEPEEVVGPCIFLASNASSLVTGHVLLVDGGYTAK